jgi:acyl-[acyl-carrier-protein] desaturase
MIGMPVVVQGPWTRGAREYAAALEVRDAFIRYFRDAMKVRNWSPWEDLPLAEMRERGRALSEDTITIIQGYLGLEHHVGALIAGALDMVHRRPERRNLHLTWGMEEMKHAEACELVLLHSGRRTEEDLEAYRDEVLPRFTALRDENPILETPLGLACYAMLQERAAFFNYEELRKRIRREYGLPEGLTEPERERGVEIGAAGAFKLVANDELAHHRVFLELVRIYLRYLPQDTLAALQKAFAGIHLPTPALIPNAAQLGEALERTLLLTPLKYARNVRNLVLDALGFEHDDALARAARGAGALPANLAPEQVSIARDGAIVLVTGTEDREGVRE